MTSPDSAPPRLAISDAQQKLLRRGLAITCWVALGLCFALILMYGYGVDQSIFAVVARITLAGGTPYRDAFDLKPPGIFFIYTAAQALFGPAHVGIRVLEVGAMLTSSAGMILLARRQWGSSLIGLVAAALAAMAVVQFEFGHTGQAENFAAPIAVWSLVLASLGLDATTSGGRWTAWLAVGFLSGFAATLKPSLAMEGPLLAVMVAIWQRREARRDFFVPVVATFIGSLVPVLVTLAWFAQRHALREMYEACVLFNRGYAGLAWQDNQPLQMAYRGITLWFAKYSSAFFVGLIALLWYRPRREERLLVIGIAASLFIQVAGVVAQGRFFNYHWNATFPLTAMLAALGLAALARRAMQLGWLAVSVFIVATPIVLVASLPNGVLMRSIDRWGILLGRDPGQKVRDRLESDDLVGASLEREVATFVLANTPEDSSLYVWGFDTRLYDAIPRRIASRFIHDQPQRVRWASEQVKAELINDLTRSQPAAIVVEKGDTLEQITGVGLDSAQTVERFPALKELLTGQYRFATSNRMFDVYLRRDLPGSVTDAH